MERRGFMKASFGLLLFLPRLDSLLEFDTFQPFEMDMRTEMFRKNLEIKDMPTIVRDSAGHNAWIPGEGKGTEPRKPDNTDQNIKAKSAQKNLISGFTPVTLLYGREFDVYGQYFDDVIGKKGIIRGFDGRYHLVYPSFIRLFTHKYICYGLPSADYQLPICFKCGKTYVSQQFRHSCKGESFYVYAHAFACSKGGSCDDLELKNLAPCGNFDDKIVVGTNF